MKEKLWNNEFANGRWDYIENTQDDCLYPILERYSFGGSILDLGCGSGNTASELGAETYDSYTGIDISQVAVAKAEERTRKIGRSPVAQYQRGEIYDYIPERRYDVILFRESLFYVPKTRILSMLLRYQNSLTSSGVFVVRMCDREKYSGILDLIRENFSVVEEYLPTEITSVIVVFR